MYESWVYSLYNFALGLPIIFYGIMDRDVPEEFALEFPQVIEVSSALVNYSTTLLPFLFHWPD
jgi:hypothetical protein